VRKKSNFYEPTYGFPTETSDGPKRESSPKPVHRPAQSHLVTTSVKVDWAVIVMVLVIIVRGMVVVQIRVVMVVWRNVVMVIIAARRAGALHFDGLPAGGRDLETGTAVLTARIAIVLTIVSASITERPRITTRYCGRETATTTTVVGSRWAFQIATRRQDGRAIDLREISGSSWRSLLLGRRLHRHRRL
jgi:heme/copper-type cytochrome/quinol oxidase subunit 2